MNLVLYTFSAVLSLIASFAFAASSETGKELATAMSTAPLPQPLAFTINDVSPAAGVRFSPISIGTAKNTINVVILRHSSVVTYGDIQFAAFYNDDGKVVLAKRKLGSDMWETKTTDMVGDIKDAHKSISLGIDGDGVLHVSWNHHGNPLNYRVGVAPGSLEMKEVPMTAKEGNSVTYPEFHSMANGDLLFLFREGGSGRGNLVVNRYDLATHTWKRLSSNLINGEGKRNAYWQLCTDANGTIHLSWVWRESSDVASNHDMSYARSTDGGLTWEKSTGEKYTLPINLATAERAATIPQKHELINQTSMIADAEGHPYIATYFRAEGTAPGVGVPQYQIIYNDGKAWHTVQVSDLKVPFTLGGGGSKKLPLSRPQILAREECGKLQISLLFRAQELGNRITLASCQNLSSSMWTYRDLTTNSVGDYEPSYDHSLWRAQDKLHVFVQRAEQVDGEGFGQMPPQMVFIAEVSLPAQK